MRARLLLVIILLTTIFATQPRPIALAQESSEPPPVIKNSLETTYEVTETGTTLVTHLFSATNLQPTQYLSEYRLTTSFPNPQHIYARSNNKEISPTVTTDHAYTTITVTFPDQVVGQGKVRQFEIGYEVPHLITTAGQVLEVQLPRVIGLESFESEIVILKTPLRFGRAVRVKPEPTSVAVQGQQIVTTFSPTEPISAFFGDHQVYSFTLRYNLENNSGNPRLAQIALPPDTTFQRVHYHSLEPPTTDLKRDQDGNWLATYELPPNTAQTVYLNADVQVSLDPRLDVPVVQPLTAHTAEKKYWETSDSSIKERVQSLTTSEAIYDKVVQELSYSYDSVQQNTINHRLGAVQAFKNPLQAVCQEFTDAFITLSRAGGIPARRLTGYAYTQNPSLRPLSLERDVLHAWPEFFDREKGYWRPVDPTWESTTGGVDYFNQFDLNHVVFAINGESSTTPYPAGSYKGSDLTTKDVEVTFGNTFPKVSPSLELRPDSLKVTGLTIPGKYTIAIINKTGQAWYDVSIRVEPNANSSVSLSQTEFFVEALLPYQQIDVPLTVIADQWHGNSVDIPYNFSVLKQDTTYEGQLTVTAGPAIVRYATKTNILIGMGFSSILGILGAWSILVFRQRRKRAVRRESKKPQETR